MLFRSTTATSGTVNNAVGVKINPMTYSAANTGITYNNPYTVYIGGAAVAGNNVTITGNNYSLHVNSGVSYFGGGIKVNSQGVTFDDGTSQTTNAASFSYSTAGFATANASFLQANSAYTKANGAVQTGFTTITANGTSITPSSNTDTLTITAATANGINVLIPSSKTIDLGLRTTGVTSGWYGGSTQIPSINVDRKSTRLNSSHT